MQPTGVLNDAYRNSLQIGTTHRIPNLETALVSKFAALVSPHRAYEKKLSDAGDLVDIVKHRLEEINVNRLLRLAEKVYLGGGAEIQQMLEDIQAGRSLRI
jgi:hypothetical protein